MSHLRLTGRAVEETGNSVLEVIIAMFLALAVIAALAGAYVRNSDTSLAGQRQSDLLSIAERQIESVRQIVTQNGTFNAVALNAYPSAGMDPALPVNPSDPNDFVLNPGTPSASLLIESNYNHTTDGQISNVPAGGEPLLVNGANGVSGGQLPPLQYFDLVTSRLTASPPPADAFASVYTYVTQASGVTAGVASSCPACAGDLRRVVVAVKLQSSPGHAAFGANAPLYTSTLVSNPIPSNQASGAVGLRLGLNIK